MKHIYDFSPLNSWMASYVDEEKFFGSSVLVAIEDNILHKNQIGKRRKDQATPFDFDTVIRIFSMTKPITSLALLILEDQGKVDLNTPLSDFIPSFKNCSALVPGATSINQIERVPSPTLMHLLTHTSGLSYSFNDSIVGKEYYSVMNDENEKAMKGDPIDTRNTMDLEKLCNILSNFPLSFHPGRKWEYSMSTDVVGRVIEIISGETLSDYFEKNIFQPSNMKDTSFFFKNDMKERLANCYFKDPSNLSYQRYLKPDTDYNKKNVKLFLGGSGLLSTINDYFKFTKIITNRGVYNGTKIISPIGIKKLTTNMLTSDISSIGPKDFSFMPTAGMGHALGGSVIINPQKNFSSSLGDYGWGGMASTYFWIDPIHKITTIFFTQLIPSDAYPNRPELKRLVRECLGIK